MKPLEISTISILHTLSKLTVRELSILSMIASGNSMEEIADAHSISLLQVQTHVCSLVEKFQLSNTSDMAAMLCEINLGRMLRDGITPLQTLNRVCDAPHRSL